MFSNVLPVLGRIKQCLDLLGDNISNYFRCRSICCNNINIYTPKKCAIMGSVSNRWMRAITPDCVKQNEAFYTPKS